MISPGYSATSRIANWSGSVQRRIGTVVRSYEEQGFHRTGTAVDQISGGWLADEVRRIGLEPAREEFSLSRVDPVGASLVVSDRRIEGLPLFDAASRIRQGSLANSGTSTAMHRLGWLKLHRMLQGSMHWVTRDGETGIRPSSS
jgi:hypothetical protein